MNVSIIIAAIGMVSSVLFAYVGYTQGKKKEHKSDGEDKGVILTDIGYIKAGIDDLKLDSKESNRRLSEVNERMTRCEESTKQAHKRIDELKGKSE